MGAPRQIGDIRLFAEIHRGGRTIVYKGFQQNLDRAVIVKVLRDELLPDETAVAAFKEEARLIAKIQHQNVLAIHDFGRSEEGCFFVTEYVEGFTLAGLLKNGPIPSGIALFILRQIATGLSAAHSVHILHKDIKPDNILISDAGQVKIADFGFSTYDNQPGITEEISCGTASYFPPEIILGNKAGVFSDIFSLGATFFEMLTGYQAFTGATTSDCFEAILKKDPLQGTGIRRMPVLSEICVKMLAKNPAERYADCFELIRHLNEADLHYEKSDCRDLVNYAMAPGSYKKMAPAFGTEAANREKNGRGLIGRRFGLTALLVLLGLGFAMIQWQSGDMAVYTEGKEISGNPPKGEIQEPDLAENEIQSTIPSHIVSAETKDERLFELRNDRTEKVEMEQPEESGEPIERALGRLEVSCRPWAAIFVDGDSVGVTPLAQGLEVEAGYRNLTFKNEQFPPHTISTQIMAGEIVRIDFSFWDTVAQLNLEISPWAEVYIDGVYKDTVPPQTRPIVLSEGTHALSLRHPVLGEWQTQIHAEPGKKLDMKFNLSTLLRL